MKIFNYTLVKKEELDFLRKKEKESSDKYDCIFKEFQNFKRAQANRDMFESVSKATDQKLISSLYEELQEMKKKYADELQKRLDLAEKVKRMED